MKLLTATTDTQGRRRSDSCTAIDGELVMPAETNDCDRYEPTSPYPRSFQGLSSGALTTTAVVRDVPLSEADLRLAVRGYLEAHRRWIVEELSEDGELEDEISAWAGLITRVGGSLPADAVVERWWDVVSVRGSAPLAPQRPPSRGRAVW